MYVPRNPGLPPRALFTPPGGMSGALDCAGLLLFSKARMGIRYALSALGIGLGETVLAPAYLTGSALAPFDWAGVACALYDVDRTTLAPDWGSVAGVQTRVKARALLLVHYFGLPCDGGIARAFCREHGLALIEDCAHALPPAPGEVGPGALGDAAIFSLRKLLPLPDGGALRLGSGRRAPACLPPRSDSPVALAPLLARYVAQRLGMHRPSRAARPPLPVPDTRPEEPAVGISRWSRWLLSCLDAKAARRTRRENYRLLMQRVAGIPGLLPLFPALPDGACPQVLPVLVPAAEQVADSLAAMGVGAYRWPTLPPRCARASETARWLAGRLLALPVHQGLDPVHLEYTADCLERVLHAR
ncbi:MAG: hypothetical protein GX785_08725 [Armatimonadetes bacterium]|nr:hypothetical protein [Armatimonadota bacterium]